MGAEGPGTKRPHTGRICHCHCHCPSCDGGSGRRRTDHQTNSSCPSWRRCFRLLGTRFFPKSWGKVAKSWGRHIFCSFSLPLHASVGSRVQTAQWICYYTALRTHKPAEAFGWGPTRHGPACLMLDVGKRDRVRRPSDPGHTWIRFLGHHSRIHPPLARPFSGDRQTRFQKNLNTANEDWRNNEHYDSIVYTTCSTYISLLCTLYRGRGSKGDERDATWTWEREGAECHSNGGVGGRARGEIKNGQRNASSRTLNLSLLTHCSTGTNAVHALLVELCPSSAVLAVSSGGP